MPLDLIASYGGSLNRLVHLRNDSWDFAFTTPSWRPTYWLAEGRLREDELEDYLLSDDLAPNLLRQLTLDLSVIPGFEVRHGLSPVEAVRWLSRKNLRDHQLGAYALPRVRTGGWFGEINALVNLGRGRLPFGDGLDPVTWDQSSLADPLVSGELNQKRREIGLALSEILYQRAAAKNAKDSRFYDAPVSSTADALWTDLKQTFSALGKLIEVSLEWTWDGVMFQVDFVKNVATGDFAAAREQLARIGVALVGGVQALWDFLKSGYEALSLLLEDPAIRRIFTRFFIAYARLTSVADVVETLVGMILELIIGLAIGAVTMGAGVAVTVAAWGRRTGRFGKRIFDLLGELVGVLRRVRRVEKAPEVSAVKSVPAPRPQPKADGDGRIPPPPVGIMRRHEPPCFPPGGKIPQSKYPEYDRQLADQQTGINDMTVAEYLEGRRRFKESGRLGQAEQRRLRKEYQAKLRKQFEARLNKEGLSADEAATRATVMAKQQMKTLAVLHSPDQVAGGSGRISGFGDPQVNSSIGSHWKGRVDGMDAAALEVPESERSKTKMNVKLERCR